MKISKSLVGQMKTDTRRQLNEQREQREFLGRIEKAVASAESVVDVVSAHNESEIDTAPGLLFSKRSLRRRKQCMATVQPVLRTRRLSGDRSGQPQRRRT